MIPITVLWTLTNYESLKRAGTGVDYGKRASEDFARGLLTLRDPDGNEVIIEATTSWAYVGAG